MDVSLLCQRLFIGNRFLYKNRLPALSRYMYAMRVRMCAHMYLCACVGGVIRPQKMPIRIDLGTSGRCLMDGVQGQTSPWGDMILSFIVQTPPSF